MPATATAQTNGRSHQRTVQVSLTITNGITRHYAAVPFQPKAPAVKACRLIKKDDATIYVCQVNAEGAASCTCRGFISSKHCKHLEALAAVGLLDPFEIIETRRVLDLARQDQTAANSKLRDLLQLEREAQEMADSIRFALQSMHDADRTDIPESNEEAPF